MIADEGCAERGCPMHDFREGPGVEMIRKPWVGLTPDEILKWWQSENGLEDCDMSRLADFIKVVYAIEAKLREKNT